jgi:hypothetical protein
MKRVLPLALLLAAPLMLAAAADQDSGSKPPPAGFTALFNGKDLSGW